MQILTGFNSEFSFSPIGCYTMAKELSLTSYFTCSWRENSWVHIFAKGISEMENADRLGQDLNSRRDDNFVNVFFWELMKSFIFLNSFLW